MKIKIWKSLFSPALLGLLTLIFQVSNNFAQSVLSNQVATLTVTYTMTANGSGTEYVGSDTVTVSLSGQEQCGVLQSGPNSFEIPNPGWVTGPVSSSNVISLSGNYTFDDPSYGVQVYPYVEDDFALDGDLYSPPGWYFSLVPVSGQVQVQGFPWFGLEETVPPDLFNPAGAGGGAVMEAMQATTFQSLTNVLSSWTQNFSTNVSLPLSFYDENGLGNCSLTATVSCVPIRFTLNFTASATNGQAPLAVQFNADSTDNLTNSIVSWNWNFGDGSTNATSTNQNPSHTYATNGTFMVTLTATNNNGTPVTGAGPTNMVVTDSTAQFIATTTNGIMPLLVQFYGPSQDSDGNAIIAWTWDLGDNSFSTVQNPQETYVSKKTATFSPKLTVTNSLGLAITATGPKIFAYYPLVAFTASPTNGLAPMKVQFNAPAQDPLLVAITNWNWNFGDGSTSTNQNPAHTYTNAGIYTVTLNTTNVNVSAVAGIGPKISAGCAEIYGFGGQGVTYSSVVNALTNSDGIHPYAGLTVSGGQLYGVMSGGGNNGSGTIFSIDPNGPIFTNLYEFTAQSLGFETNGDGASPRAQLALNGGTLYGSASAGGAMNGGTVFSINTNGSDFTNLYNFSSSGGSGYSPNGVLFYSNALYGTAQFGGSNNSGTIFAIGPAGFAPIYEFTATEFDYATYLETNADGADPAGPLIVSGNSPPTLYGTASQGGAGGGGTIFAVSTDGLIFTVLHSFTNRDGESPHGGLVLSGNTLYGTTEYGGNSGYGTVFKVNTDGSDFTNLYSFSSEGYDPVTLGLTNSDGAYPESGLLLSGGMLYGTTESGGANGSGTLFAVDTNNGSGFAVLYTFSLPTENAAISAQTNLDGANPYATLAQSGQTLYATTYAGGNAGEGAIFALSLAMAPPALSLTQSGKTLKILWPYPSSGWVLQQNSSLNPNNWTPTSYFISNDGTNNFIVINSPAGNLFFRLSQ